MMDLATKLRVVCPLLEYDLLAMQAETSDMIMDAFTSRWMTMFPKPDLVILDSARSFISEKFNRFLSELNIVAQYTPTSEHWANGIVEAGIQDVKRTATLIHMDRTDHSPSTSLVLAVSALNSTEYTAGFSSNQWAFGKHYSISDEDHRTFQQVDPSSEFSALVQARQRAEEVAVKSRAQRVLSKLSNTSVRQPLRSYSPFQLVKIWRQYHDQLRGARGGYRKTARPHWIGPGRVLFQEVLPHQPEGDHRRHILWVLIGSRVFRCSVHSVRPVTEPEQLEYELTSPEDPTRWKSLEDIIPKREFTDVVSETPAEGEIELPDLPAEPDETTYAPIRRAVGKTTLGPGDWKTLTRRSLVGTSSSDRSVGHSLRQATEDATSVNDYDEPTSEPLDKKARTDYDLKWLQTLEELAEEESKTYDVFHFLQQSSEDYEVLTMEFEVEPESNTKRRALLRNPVAYMVKKLNNSEVNIQKLSQLDKVLFQRAKTKEVKSFLKNEAVRKCLDDAEVREAYSTNRIVKARWVLTWKPIPPDEREEARAEVRAQPDSTMINADATKKAKARIVLLGFQHPSLLDRNFKTAAPVQSGLGRSLLYFLSVFYQWEIEGLDLATAFLQTQPTAADQQLWTSGVAELKEAMGLPQDAILRILKNIYGSTTAPRGLWLDLHKTLGKIGGKPALGERCLWLWFSRDRKDQRTGLPLLLGAMGGHVDDFHRVGNRKDPEWVDVCTKIDGSYQWGTVKKRSYRHAGTDINTIDRPDGTFYIEVDQDAYVEGLTDLEISTERMRLPSAPLTSKEVAACRASLGALQWLAIQTQPQLCSRCNLLLTEIIVQGDTSHAREIQGMIGEVRRHPQRLRFAQLPDARHWTEVVFVTMGDQAHNNRPKGDSTGGMITLLAGPTALTGKVAPMILLSWKSWKLKRKAIASNDAEIQAVLESEDHNFRARLLWTEIHGASALRDNPRLDLVEVAEKQALTVKGVLCTDSRGGYDAVETNESPLLGLTNMRAALQAFQLRENLRRCGSDLRWVASDYDLADAMTKKKQESREGLMKLLSTWHWSIAYDPNFVAAKKNKKAGLTAIDTIDKALESFLATTWRSSASEMPELQATLTSAIAEGQWPIPFFHRCNDCSLAQAN